MIFPWENHNILCASAVPVCPHLVTENSNNICKQRRNSVKFPIFLASAETFVKEIVFLIFFNGSEKYLPWKPWVIKGLATFSSTIFASSGKKASHFIKKANYVSGPFRDALTLWPARKCLRDGTARIHGSHFENGCYFHFSLKKIFWKPLPISV